MGYQGMLIEIAKEYVVLATSQSQSLMCGGQMSCNKHAMDGWAPIEPQIVWNRSAVLGLPQSSPGKPERQHHYTGQLLAEKKTPEDPARLIVQQPRLPQRNPGAKLESPNEPGPSSRILDEDTCRMTPEKSAAAAAAKGKKRFKIFRAMRSVIKGRFRK